MTSPVMRALVAARLQQINQTDADIEAAVTEILGPAPGADQAPAAPFVAWCQAKGLPSRPASPGSVALYMLEHQSAGIEPLLQILKGISAAHEALAMSDPTTSWSVTSALSRITRLVPPRSWPKAEREMFARLPYALQHYVAMHEDRREREIRRAHNEAAALRHELKSLRPKEDTNGTTENCTTNA